MTKIEVCMNDSIYIQSRTNAGIVYLSTRGEVTDLDVEEARELVKALKKHIKKAEGK